MAVNVIQPFTRTALYNFVNSLLFNANMDSTLFDHFLDDAQAYFEEVREWRVLRAVDASLSVGPGNSFTTPFTIAPTNGDFRSWANENAIVLTQSGGTNNIPFIVLEEVPYEMRYVYQNVMGKFYCDYANGNFYICGTIPGSYTIQQFYLKQMAAISYNTASGGTVSYPNTWGFPARFHSIIGYAIALKYKGVDYDIINLQNASNMEKEMGKVWEAMTYWDDKVQRMATQNVDPFATTGGGPWTGNSAGGTIGSIS
jgi:hypothetical protein